MEETFTRSSRIEAPADKLRAWHFEADAFSRLNPPWEKAEVIESPGELTDGARAVIDVGMGPFKQRWVAVHEITEDGFIDRQEEGPFVFWEHHHQFLPLSEEASELRDSIRYRLPMGWLGRIFGGPFVRRKLDRMFTYRHEITKSALEK
ncbi:MAG: SRPBCC family protein [Verrucomicrobiales bacterium]|nr:SRPBCC family protein [Verrucomicrobiales bacterium]